MRTGFTDEVKAMTHQDSPLGTAPVGKLVLQLAIPAMLAQFVNILYSVVDRMYVGHIANAGDAALAGVGVCAPVVTMITALGALIGFGGGPLMSIRMGRRDMDGARQIAANSFYLLLALSVMATVPLLVFRRQILFTFGCSEALWEYAEAYFTTYVSGTVFAVMSYGLNQITMSQGFASTAMRSVMLGAAVNIALDPVFIFALNMGVRGAALATVIGQIFGMALGLWGVFRHQKVLNVNMKAFKWNRGTVGDIYRVGLPGIVMQSVVSVMTAGMNGILIAFSQTAVNVLGVYFKLQTFVFMPVFGLNQGALPVMGYNYGARNRRRLMGAYRITLTAAVVIMALGLVLFQLLPEQMLMLFVDRTDAAAAQEMIEVGVPALKTISLSFLGAAFGIINSTLFQATARGMNSLIVSVCRQLVVILPAAWILGQQFGLNAVWYAFPIAEVASFFISYILLWREYRTELRFLGTEKEKKA